MWNRVKLHINWRYLRVIEKYKLESNILKIIFKIILKIKMITNLNKLFTKVKE